MNIISMRIMNLKDRDRLKKIISIILLLLWCLLIFYFSSQNGEISTNSSSHVIDLLNKLFNTNLYNYEYSVLIVRKCAHMFLYFILFLLSYNVFNQFKIKKIYLYSILLCIFYSISDEIHQLFIIERSFMITDIIIDNIGSFLSLMMIKILKRK